MAGPAHDPDEEDREEPLDPAVERVRRKLVRFMAINLGLLFAALMVVLAAIVYRTLAPSGPSAPAAAVEAPIVVPAGARVEGHALGQASVSLLVLLEGGERVLFVYDLQSGRMTGRFAIVEE